MKPVTVTTTVQRPREEVFDFLAPLANHEQFTDHVLTNWRVSPDGRRAEITVKTPGKAQEVVVEALEEERPGRTVERTTGAGGKRTSLGTYRLTDAPGGGTHVEFEVAFEKVPTVEKLTMPLGRAWLKKVNQRSMERLKEQLEGASSAGR